jgi:hypothetical protein
MRKILIQMNNLSFLMQVMLLLPLNTTPGVQIAAVQGANDKWIPSNTFEYGVSGTICRAADAVKFFNALSRSRYFWKSDFLDFIESLPDFVPCNVPCV